METAKLLSWPQLYHGRRGSSPGATPETTFLAGGVLDAQWLDYVPTTNSVPDGCQERIYRTPATGTRKFLRLRMELAP